MSIVVAGENFAERGEGPRPSKPGSYCKCRRGRPCVAKIRSITDLLAPNAANGRPPPIDLARQINVGVNVEVFAGAAPAEFGAGFYFVENQERAIFRGEVAKTFQETRLGHAEADIHQNGLKNDGGNFAGIFFEAPLDAAEVIEGGNGDVGRWRIWAHPIRRRRAWDFRCHRSRVRGA